MDLKLNAAGDIDLTDGQVSLVTGIDAIRQHLTIKLRTFLGEWFLDDGIGIDYFQRVFVKNPDNTILNTIFTREISNTPGVISLNELSFSLNNGRSLGISFSVTTEFGVLDHSLTVGV